MHAGWVIPFILLGGALQACGGPMNNQLKNSLVNPFLASTVSFAIIMFFFAAVWMVRPVPLPTPRISRLVA